MKEERKQIVCSKSTIILSIISLLLAIADVFCVIFLLNMSTLYTVLWLIAFVGLFLFTLIFWFTGLKSFLKLTFTANIICTLIIWGYWVLILCGLKEIFSSSEALQNAVNSTGMWGRLVYVLIQFLQVTFIPLPAMVTTLAGTALFGPLEASLLSLVGIMLGSVFAFWLGDKFGEKVCIWIAGKEATEKYSKLLYEKGKYLFFLMMLFPLFPDDVLCLVAGMTSMSFRYFFTTIILTRPIGIFMTCYLGSGQIIPYSGWGLVVWGVIIAFMIAMFICAYKFQPQIENFLGKVASKMSGKEKRKKIKLNVIDNNREETVDNENPKLNDVNDENKKSSE